MKIHEVTRQLRRKKMRKSEEPQERWEMLWTNWIGQTLRTNSCHKCTNERRQQTISKPKKIAKLRKWTWMRTRKWTWRKQPKTTIIKTTKDGTMANKTKPKGHHVLPMSEDGETTPPETATYRARELVAMEEQTAPPAMINSVSSYDNMRGLALNF